MSARKRWFERTTGRRHSWWLDRDEPARVAIDTTPAPRPGPARTNTVAGMYEQLAQEGRNKAVEGLRKMLADSEPAVAVWTQMAATVEDAAGVVAFFAGDFEAAAGARCELLAQARALVALAGRLEEAADCASADL